MKKRKSAGGLLGTGSIMLTIIQSIHPEWLGNHPWVLPASLSLFVLSLLIFSIQFSWVQWLLGVRPISDEAAGGDNRNAVLRDGIGIAGGMNESSLSTHVGHNLFGTDAIKEHLARERSNQPPPQLEPAPLPVLKCHAEWIYALYEPSPGAWQRAEPDWMGAEKIAIAVFENPTPAKGLAGIPLRDIEANLNFHGSTRRVKTAYWFDSNCNRIDIRPGHDSAVVLGRFIPNGDFVSNENTHIFSAQGDWPCVREIGEEKRIMPTDGSIWIDVTLAESRKPNRTIETVSIALTPETCRVITHGTPA